MADPAGRSETIEERESTFRFLDEQITEQSRQQAEFARALETRATLVVGFVAAAMPFALGNRRGGMWTGALVVFGLSLATALVSLWPRRWEGLDPEALRDELSDLAPAFAVGQVAGTKVVVMRHNASRLRVKLIQWATSMVLLVLATVLLALSTVMEASR